MKLPRIPTALSTTLATLTLATSLPAAPDFTTLPSATNSLEEFARQVTPQNAKWGGPEFALEALIVRLPATEQLKELPAEPTPEILAASPKFRILLRPGLAAGVEQLTMIDRTPSGAPVANPKTVGVRFYAYALPLDSDKTENASSPPPPAAYDVRLMLSHILLEGFQEKEKTPHSTFRTLEVSSQLHLSRGWLLMGGNDETTRVTENTIRRSKILRGLYFRIADEHPAQPAHPPMQPASTTENATGKK